MFFKNLVAILIVTSMAACGGGGGGSRNRVAAPATPPPATPPPEPVEQVVNTNAYRSTSLYADVLRDCTYAGDNTQICDIATLPFLGQDTNNPTIDDVMDRALVSHTWMGDNFLAALQQLPPDMLLMLRSVTAVVIASDIRPAFYDPATGAIYLDSDFLWLTTLEEADVTDEEDFRAGFGDALQFKMPWRYVRNNQRLGIQLNPDGSRDLSQLLPILGFLMYHELAHAVDFMPQQKMAGLATNLSVEDAILSGPFLSSAWSDAQPLMSDTILDLAQVSFHGDTATADQEAILPDDLVTDFGNDGAVQYYSYSSQFEDFATSFETVMMDFHFGYEKDTGITTSTQFSDDGILSWGQRRRIGGQNANIRALAAIQAMYPGDLASVELYLTGLQLPIQMTAGTTWGNNLVLGPAPSSNDEGIEKRTFDDILQRRSID